MANEFVARNGLIVISGEIKGLLASGIVLSGSIASGQVNNFKLSSGAIISNLQSGSLVSGLFANASVVSESIASGQIGQMHLSSGAISSGQIANASVVSGSIASGQVNNFSLSSGAIIFNLQSGGIVSGLLGNNAVTSGSIASGQISQMHLMTGIETKGYFAGGFTGAIVATTDKLTYSNDTTIAQSTANLSAQTYYLAGVSEGTSKGYFGGGERVSGITKATDKITYSNDSNSAQTTANLSQSRATLCGVSGEGTKGYFAGGRTTGISTDIVATTDKLNYSNDTTSSQTTANLTQSRTFLAGVSEGISKGYFAGGQTGTTGAATVVSTAEKLTYSNDTTTAQTSANLSQSRTQLAGVSGEGTKGYFAGGYSGAYVSTANKLTYSTDTTAAQTSANLTQTKATLAGISEGTSKGYFAGGFTPNIIVATADKITYSNDTTAAQTTANLSQARHSLAGVSCQTSTPSFLNNGQLANASVVSGSIASGQINNFSFSSGAAIFNLQSGSIGSGLFASASVLSGAIASGQIGQMHLSSGAISSGQIANASIVSGSIASGQIRNFHLSSGAALANLQSGSINSGLVANASVVSGSIGSGQIGQHHLAAPSISSGHFANASVLSGSISSSEVGRMHLASGCILSGHTTSGAVFGSVIGSGAVVSGNLASGQIGFSALGREIYNNDIKLNNFRVSVVSGVPITSGNLTSQNTLYLAPYNGDSILLYNGTDWSVYTTSGKSVSISTAALSSGYVYDVYCYLSNGSPTLGYSLGWTNINTRAESFQYQNGVPVISGNPSNRIVATVYARQSGVVDDSYQYRGVWNWDNRVSRPMYWRDTSTNTYTVSGSLNNMAWNLNSGASSLFWVQGYPGLGCQVSMSSTTRRNAGAATAYARLDGITNAFVDFIGNLTASATAEYKTATGIVQCVNGLNYFYPRMGMNASGQFFGSEARLYNILEG